MQTLNSTFVAAPIKQGLLLLANYFAQKNPQFIRLLNHGSLIPTAPVFRQKAGPLAQCLLACRS